MKSKRDEVTTITLCKLKLKKYILYLILSIGMSLYQEGCYIDYQQSLLLNKSINTQVRWVKRNGHTYSTSHWIRKNRMVRFPKPEGPVWTDELQQLVFKYRMFRFLGDKYKIFPPPSFGGCYTHPKPLWALLNPSLWGFCDLWENISGGLKESSLWALEQLSFVKQSLWHLLLLKVKPHRRLDVILELLKL
jgi:hypothetical protein